MNKEAFQSEWSLKPVTIARAAVTGIVKGECITIIDTPGFLDPTSLNTVEEFKGLAKAIIDMPNGVNAVGLFINLRNRIIVPDVKLLEMLVAMEEMLPHVFLVFTHAIVLGKNEEEQQQKIEETLKDKKKCPEILQSVLSKIDNRYMLLESVDIKGEGYYEKKSQELLDILQGIMNKTGKVYTNHVNRVTEILKRFDVDCQLQEKDRLLEDLAADLETVKANSKPDTFWRNFALFVGGGVVIGLGAAALGAGAVFSPAIAAAGSRVLEFVSKNPDIVKMFKDGMLAIANLPK